MAVGASARGMAGGRGARGARLVMLLAMLLLVGACRSSAVAQSSSPSHPAPPHAHVSKDAAERYARGLAKAAWRELQLLPKQLAIADIHASVQAFSDMTGCTVMASHRRNFSQAAQADFVAAVFRNVIVAVKCP
jgi:hypothetical protein